MKQLLFAAILFLSASCKAQELFSMTEPASNMAAGSISIRIDNSIMDEINSLKINYHLIPAIRFGVSKKLMIQGNAFFSNRNKQFKGEGGSLYAKYRFLSKDALQKHFRMAVFGTVSCNNSDIHQEEINMYGHNTGFEAGIVATQLLYKVALSFTVSMAKAFDNGNNNKYVYGLNNSKVINYSLSFGKLMLPKHYSDFRQTNINLMVETLSQVNTGSGKYYLDVVPTLQFIFNSQSRIDIGYKKQISSTLLRTAPNGFFIRVEHNFFNVF
ncbi:MAG: hypothetical protein JWP81_464 [Ferruginibacter sp.]|nr:hypothetical protein [Ferruginibacter sp.]